MRWAAIYILPSERVQILTLRCEEILNSPSKLILESSEDIDESSDEDDDDCDCARTNVIHPVNNNNLIFIIKVVVLWWGVDW